MGGMVLEVCHAERKLIVALVMMFVPFPPNHVAHYTPTRIRSQQVNQIFFLRLPC